MQPIVTRNASLADQVLDVLIERIRQMIYPSGSQLPPENELATEFGVSRATVRTAISKLAARGQVVRRQGVGTFVSHLSSLSNPLNEATDFHTLITSNGYKSGERLIKADMLTPSPTLIEALNLTPDQLVLQSHKILTADGSPVIYCITSVPSWVLNAELDEPVVDYPGLTQPLYRFLERHCNQRVEYHIAKLRADIAQNCEHVVEIPYDPLTPMLVITEVGYNVDERPVFHSLEYYPGNHMSFEIIRRRGPMN
jgi:GntR family transcriptional regulator